MSRNDPAAEPMVARDATYYRAPDALREQVRERLAREAGAADRARPWSFLAMAASFAVVAIVTWNVATLNAGPGADDVLARELVTAHVRSLMTESHLNDVVSSDQHTVKPWFAGKLDFAPPVRDLANMGFALAGGRLDYLNERAVAVLTYRYRQHVVNVFIWPEAGESAPRVSTRQGYSLVQWAHGGMRYSAVSDASAAQVLPLADALRAENAS
ncbi:MAG: anti-sigma factor family protein [Usitatibacter sp.]